MLVNVPVQRTREPTAEQGTATGLLVSVALALVERQVDRFLSSPRFIFSV